MRRFGLGLALMIAVVLVPGVVRAQSIDDLNLQVHGYVVQAFVKSNQNSWNTTDSENGSASWNEAVVNLSLQPQAKLKIGVQGRFQLLGDSGGDGNFTVDWAQLDYTANSYFGFRVGDVKTPMGLLNETQDIDPAHLWVLLPQSVYPIASRNSILDHFGGVVYGAVALGERGGKLQYRGFGGERVMGPNDGYFQGFRDEGVTLPNGMTGLILGGTLKWEAPVRGLMVGASLSSLDSSGEIVEGPYQGTNTVPRFESPYYFGKYERGRWMVAGEYNRLPALALTAFAGAPVAYNRLDQRAFYAMASYKATEKLTGGVYYSSSIDKQSVFTSARYQKDWAVAARYDFNSFLYAKAEQHFIDGTEIGFAKSDNPNLQPTTRMTMLKLGVSF